MDSSPPPSPPSSHQFCALHVGCEFDTVESLKQLCHDLVTSNSSRDHQKLHTPLFAKAKGVHGNYTHSQSIALVVFVSKYSIPSTVASASIMAEINKQLQH